MLSFHLHYPLLTRLSYLSIQLNSFPIDLDNSHHYFHQLKPPDTPQKSAKHLKSLTSLP
jgi:hypothetical protein